MKTNTSGNGVGSPTSRKRPGAGPSTAMRSIEAQGRRLIRQVEKVKRMLHRALAGRGRA